MDKILDNEMKKSEFKMLVSELLKLGYHENELLEDINQMLRQLTKEFKEMQ